MLPIRSAVRLAAASRATSSATPVIAACRSASRSELPLSLYAALPYHCRSSADNAESLTCGRSRIYSTTASLAVGHKRRIRLRMKRKEREKARQAAPAMGKPPAVGAEPNEHVDSDRQNDDARYKKVPQIQAEKNPQEVRQRAALPKTEDQQQQSSPKKKESKAPPQQVPSQHQEEQQRQPPQSAGYFPPGWETNTYQDMGFEQYVKTAGWGPTRSPTIQAEQQVAAQGVKERLPAESWQSVAAESQQFLPQRTTSPHVALPMTTKLLDRSQSAQARKIEPGSYLSDRQWAAYDQEKKGETALTAQTGGRLTAKDVSFEPIAPLRKMEVARLAHGLERVLFNPGVHRLKDPRSGVYNYPSSLKHIPDVDLFDYQALPAYITSSVDEELRGIAEREQAQFCGSTSSLTSMLSQVYFLVSGWKLPSVEDFSKEFAEQPKGYSLGAKLPAQIALKPRTSTDPNSRYKTYYAIDQDKDRSESSSNSNYVLQNLGKAMEKMLTATPEAFAKYLRVNRPSGPSSPENVKEAYHYAKAGTNFVMRSQLDCQDDRLPRGTFDLKTRAVVTVRHDRANWVEASGYQINEMKGLFESFERERYDMARSAWLKYFFQAKIGCMDGIFVAYHNSAEVFGFEYFPLEDMAVRLFGNMEMADQAFKLSVALSEKILQRAVALYPDRELSLLMETKEPQSANRYNREDDLEAGTHTMRVWVEPSDASREDGSSEPEEEREDCVQERKITQFDITVDRYMWDSLIHGAVDFEADAFKMKSTGVKGSSEAQVLQRPFELQLEYTIRPRGDLSENTTLANQAVAASRLRAMNALVLPNVEVTNARERRLEAELSKNPEALQRYKEDKKSGIAPGMPRAPGQIDLFRLDDDGEVEVSELPADATAATEQTGADDGEDVEGKKVGRDKAEESALKGEGKWRAANHTIMELRRLSQKGAQERDLAQKSAR